MTPRFELIAGVPEWSLCYLINGDPTELTDEEIQMCEDWLKRNDIAWVCPPEDDTYTEFDSHPSFGKACGTYKCYCAMKDQQNA